MTFPSILATATSSGSGSSAAVSLPASIGAGQLLLLFIQTTSGTSPSSTPAGWTSLSAQTARGFAAYYKYASGSEGASVAVALGSSLPWTAVSYRVLSDGTTAPAYTDTTVNSNTTVDPPNLAPGFGTATSDILWLAVGAWLVSATALSSGPASYALQNDQPSGGHLAVYSRNKTGASENPGAINIGSNDNLVGATIAVAPANNAPMIHLSMGGL